VQAKTTKKIVLRLQCQACKHVTQHPIKVSFFST
jgi:large subunit ribosomal protein L44e